MNHTITHLQLLEAESIHVIREVAAEFEKPVLLFSGGKDSMCLVHLAQKAFAPGRIPFPLLHIATTWDFRELLEFRDMYCQTRRLTLDVHTNQDALAAGINPFDFPTP
jgi:sulfate adenylyltransferase subunit 2